MRSEGGGGGGLVNVAHTGEPPGHSEDRVLIMQPLIVLLMHQSPTWYTKGQ